MPWGEPHGEHFERNVREQLDRIERKVDRLMAAQDDINAAITALQADETGLDASVQRILAAIADLQSQGVDTSALTAEVQNLQGHVDAVAAIEPVEAPIDTPPVEPPAPFVAKIAGESFADYVARAEAAGLTPSDEATWDALAPDAPTA